MAKSPKESEVIMYGEKSPTSQRRAEIITVGKNGKHKVDQGGVSRTPLRRRQPPEVIEADPVSPPPPAPPPPVAQPKSPPPPAPAAKPAPEPSEFPVPRIKNPASAKEQSRAMAESAVGSFVDQLRRTAEANGGVMTLRDIDNMQAELAQKTREMEAQFEAAFEQYAEARERLQWSMERDDPFFRLLVKQFSHLFKEKTSKKTVSRRMLPGFFMAVGMLLGPDLVETYHSRCRNIIAGLQSEHGDENFDWEAFYGERDALTVSLDAQTSIAAQFKEYDRRMAWFLTLVNSHLAAPEPGMSEAEQRWEMAEAGFRRMMDAMLSDLRKVLSSDKGRERLIKRNGAETVNAALVTLKRLVTG